MARELTCIEMVELVSDYLEGELDARARAQFEEHLAERDHRRFLRKAHVIASQHSTEYCAGTRHRCRGFGRERAATHPWCGSGCSGNDT